jgi:hypothetical protein
VRPPNVLLRDMTANPVPLGNRTAVPSLLIIDGKFTSKSPYSTLLFTSCLLPGKLSGTTSYGRSATWVAEGCARLKSVARTRCFMIDNQILIYEVYERKVRIHR